MLLPESALERLLAFLLVGLLNGLKISLISFFLSFSSIVFDFLSIDNAGDSSDIFNGLRCELSLDLSLLIRAAALLSL